jgi:hypothetical protein
MKKVLFLLATLAAFSASARAADVSWAAGVNHGFSLANGTALNAGALVRLGYFKHATTGVQLTDAEILALVNTPSTLDTHFVQAASASIGSGLGPSNPAGHFAASNTVDTGASGLNLAGKQMYLWVMNSGSPATATEHAVLYWTMTDTTTNPDGGTEPGPRWIFPVQEPVPGSTAVDLDDLTTGSGALAAGARLVIGSYPTGTSPTTAANNFGLTAVSSAPTITTASTLPNGTEGSAYNQALAATGGTGAYTWSITGGTLPEGITLSSSTGALSGTPTDAGEYSFTVQVMDSAPSPAISTKFFALDVDFPAMVVTTASPLPNAFLTLPYSRTLAATGGDGTFGWFVNGGSLPPGITLSTAGVLSGTPTGTGTFNFTVQVLDGSGSGATKAMQMVVLQTLIGPVMDPPVLPTTVVGTAFTYQLSAGNYPKTFTVRGLPPGLKVNSKTGLITGRPTAAGVYIVQVSATNAKGSSPLVSAQLVIQALPTSTVGTYLARVEPQAILNGNTGGRIDLKTASNGSYTIALTMGATKLSGKGSLSTSVGGNPTVNSVLGTFTVALTLDPTTNLLAGVVSNSMSSSLVSGWRKTWDKVVNPANEYIGYYSVGLDLTSNVGNTAVPQGTGFASFTIATDGALTVAGKAADGSSVSTPGFIGPQGQILIHQALYSNLGSIHGTVALTPDSNNSYTENTVAGQVVWNKPNTTTGTTYTAPFGPLTLDVGGMYLARASKGSIVLGLPSSAATASLNFAEGGVEDYNTNPDVAAFTFTSANKVVMPTAGTPANPGKVKLSINAASGAVAGEFSVSKTNPAVTKKAKFQGITVRSATGNDKAFGYYLLQQPTSTTMLSGQVVISQ